MDKFIMSKSKFIIPGLLVVILLLLGFIGFSIYQMNNSSNSKKDILDRVDKLSSLEIDLVPITMNNYYQFQNPDMNSKIQTSLDKLEKGSVAAKRVFDEYNGKNIDKVSRSYIDQFNLNFAKFKTDKKEFDCLYQAYNDFMGQNNVYGMATQDPDKGEAMMRIKLDDAKKCGLILDETKAETMLTNFKELTNLSKEMSNQYSNGVNNGLLSNVIPIQDKYTPPTAAQMEAQNKMGMKFGEATTKFSNSVFEIVNSKYTPLVEYSRFIKSSQDNF